MIGLAIRLALGGKALITRALSWATANATRMLAVALALALAWVAIERHGKHKAQKVLASTVNAWKAAEREATKLQAEKDARQVTTNEAVNKGSTDANDKGLDAARSAVAAYARLHPASRCASGQTKPVAVSADPGVDAGAGEAPGMASITVADLDTLAAGTVRAESCRAWGQSMIDAGLAEKDE